MARWTLLRHCLNDWEYFLYRARKICLLRIHALILGVTQGRSPWWVRVRVSGKNRSIASRMTLLKWANLSKQEFSEKNPKYHYSYLFFFTINKGDLPLMYSWAFWCEFIDLVVFFFWLLLFDPCRILRIMKNQWIHTKKHRNTSKVTLLYLFHRKISKNNDI